MKLNVVMTALICLVACESGAEAPGIVHDLEGVKQPWTSDTPRFAPRDFQFVVVSDNTGTPRPGIFKEAMEKVQLLQPAFVMSVGDLIDGYVRTEAELQAQWDEFFGYLKPLTVPFFFVPGNHDAGRQLWHDVYLERVGPTYYYFLYQDVLFLILNSNDGPDKGTGYGEEQLVWAKEVLAKHTDVRWTYLIQHKPFWLSEPELWGEIAPVIADRNITVFAGHIHNYLSTKVENIHYVTLGTTGGGTALRGVAYGEFDHVLWVTATDEGPQMAALTLDGILPVDIRTPELAQALEPFRRRTVVQAKPVAVEGEMFTEGVFEITVSNPWDKPLRFEGLVEAQAEIGVSPSALRAMIGPGETFTGSVAATAESGVTVGKLQPLVLHWSATYDNFNAPPMQFNGKTRLFLEAIGQISEVEAVMIDGNLAEWTLPYTVSQPGDIYTNEQSWKGPQDATFKFGLARDNENLYAAIEVIDDAVSGEGTKVYQDFAAFYVRPVVDPAAQADAPVVGAVAGLTLSEEEILDYEEAPAGKSNAEHGVQTAVSTSGPVIRYEFSIPLALLRDASGALPAQLQVNPAVQDYDESDARLGVSLLSWRPRWSAESPADSGVFQLAE